jgi:hypothetical protein
MLVMSRQRFRTVFDLQRDKTLPSGVYGERDDERFKPMGKRMYAIEEVFCRLPEEQYERWKARIDEVAWFIPDCGLWGRVAEFPNKKIIYLNPFLECLQSDTPIVGLVVHEVGHFLLDHVGSKLSREQKEEEMNRAIREWGFSEEADAADKELWSFFKSPEQQGEVTP